MHNGGDDSMRGMYLCTTIIDNHIEYSVSSMHVGTCLVINGGDAQTLFFAEKDGDLSGNAGVAAGMHNGGGDGMQWESGIRTIAAGMVSKADGRLHRFDQIPGRLACSRG